MKNRSLIKVYFTMTALLLAWNCFGQDQKHCLKKQTVLTGEIMGLTIGKEDSLALDVNGEFGSGNLGMKEDTILSMFSNRHHFRFVLPDIKRPTYISLRVASRSSTEPHFFVMFNYLIEPGDQISLICDKSGNITELSGKGADKFRIYTSLVKREYFIEDSLPQYKFNKDPEKWLNNQDLELKLKLQALDRFKEHLSNLVYHVLKADIIAVNRVVVYNLMRLTTFTYGYHDPSLGNVADSLFRVRYANLPIDTIDKKYLVLSAYYANYIMNKISAEYDFRKYHHLPNEPTLYDAIIKASTGRLQDKVTVSYLYNSIAFSVLSDLVIQDALASVKDSIYREKVIAIQNRRGANKPVNGFLFPDKDGSLIDLSRYKGKVVLIDMWFTGCLGCINVARALPDVEAAFRGDSNVVFISLSIDKEKEKWLRSIDPKNKVSGRYTHYTTPSTVYCFTGGTAGNNGFIKRYNLTGSYPNVLLIGKNGNIYVADPPRPDTGDGKERLIEVMKKAESVR